MAVLANSGTNNGVSARDRVLYAINDERSNAFVGEAGDFIAGLSTHLGMTSEAVRRGIDKLWHEGVVAKLMCGRFIIGCGLIDCTMSRTESRYVSTNYPDAEWLDLVKRRRPIPTRGNASTTRQPARRGNLRSVG